MVASQNTTDKRGKKSERIRVVCGVGSRRDGKRESEGGRSEMCLHIHIYCISSAVFCRILFFFIQFAVHVKEKKNFNNSKKDLIAAKFSSSSCLNVPSSISLSISGARACFLLFIFFVLLFCEMHFRFSL